MRRLSSRQALVTILSAALLGVIVWHLGARKPEASASASATSPALSPAAPQTAGHPSPPPPAPAPPPPRLTSLDPARRHAPSATSVPDRWSEARTLRAETLPVTADDPTLRFRVRLIEADFKHPLLRIEETLRIDPATGSETLLAQVAMVADHVLLKPAPGVTEATLLARITALGGTVRSRKPASGLYLVTIPAPLELDGLPAAIASLQSTPGLLRLVEPDYVVHAIATPADPSYGQLWGLHNTGQSGGVADADIDAPEAWDIATGSRDIVVGVIDTGIDHTHPDLAANMWTNPGEIAGNNIDDDGNGYVDDTRGWDFVNNDNNPADDHYHGTHCAGTIGAVGDNGVGVVGVAHEVSLVGLKFLSASGGGTTSDAVEAVAYATGLGLDLTSNSWGGGGYSQALYDAIQAAGSAGQLFIAAAGNNASNTDFSVNYPSGYALDNIVSVAATDHADALASFSNYGAASVDLGAPGVSTYSTAPGNTYRSLSGTSMATPHVAGAAAVLLAHAPSLSAPALKTLLLSTTDAKPALAGRTVTGGRLNLHSALLGLDNLLVSPASGFTASGPVGGPFPATSLTYTLTNLSSSPRPWSAQSDVPWISLDATSGTVPAGGSATVTASLVTSAAQQLTPGNHTGAIRFNDLSNNREHVRASTLTVTPPAVFTFNLDTDPGWTRTGEWAYGQPAGFGGGSYGNPDPASGHTGPRVLGINLNGNYSTAAGSAHTLTAGPFNLSGYAATRLQFRRWLNSDYEGWVSSRVEISTNGSTWTRLWSNGNAFVTDSAWVLQDFDLAAIADNQPTVYLRWVHHVVSNANVWPLSGWNIDDISILGAPPLSVSIDPLPPAAEGSGALTATLRVQPAPATATTVEFTSSAPALVPAPAALTLPAGATSAPVPLTVLDNTLLDGTRTVRITPVLAGHLATSLSLAVQDDETATLSLVLPSSATEGDAPASGTLQVSAPPATPITVTLSANPLDAAVPPATVSLPAGATQTTFSISFPDNLRIEGSRTATLAASVPGWTAGSAQLTVADNEARTLSVTLAPGLAEGRGLVSQGGTVTLAGSLATPLVVALASSDSTQLSVPASVTIPAGAIFAKFDLALPDDAAQDGVRSVTVTATADTFSAGSATAPVADNDPASFAFATVASPQYVGQAFSATIAARDIDGAPASGFTGTAALSGAIASQPASMLPAQTGAFVGGVWTGALTCQAAGENWTLRATLGAASGVSNGFTVRVPVVQTIALANNDIVYDPGTDRIYASTPSGTLVPINPANGALGTPVTVAATATTRLARASDGSRLWVVHDNGRQALPVALPALTAGTSFNFGTSSYGGSYQTYAADILALPGSPQTLIVSRGVSGLSPSHDGVHVFDNGVRRATATASHTGSNSIAAGPNQRIYGSTTESSGYEFWRLQVSVSGISVVDSRGSMGGGLLTADGTLVASTNGRIMDGENYRILASLPYSGPIRPDAAARRIYLLSDQGGGVRRIRSYDTERFSEIGSFNVSGVSGTPGTLLRWGAGGLAFRTPTQVIILNTPLVPAPDSADLQVTQLATPDPAVVGQPLNYLVSVRNLGGGPAASVVLTDTFPAGSTPTGIVISQGTVASASTQLTATLGTLAAGAEATLSFTVTPSASGAAANIAQASSPTGDPDTANNESTSSLNVTAAPALALRRLSLGASDLAYDAVSDRLLVTLGNTAPVFPNSLLRLDPVRTAVLSANYLGDNPTRLKLTSDGAYAYSILNGTFSLARAPIVPGGSPSLNFPVGHTGSIYGLLNANDISPITNRAEAVAVARSDSSATVALYENGIILPTATAYYNGASVLVDSPNGQRIYGYNNQSSGFDFYKFDVLPNGVSTAASQSGLVQSYSVNRLKRGGSLVYTNNGRIIDPEAFTLVANLGYSGPIEPSLDDDRIYVLDGSTLRTFDLQTRAPAGTLALGTLDGTPTNLVRCGGRSLAFVTSNGVLYLLDAPALVPPPPLRVVLPARLTEGTGNVPGIGRVEILRPAETDIAVTLASSAPDVLDVTRTLVIPAGQTSASFSVQVTDNTGLNGTRPVLVSPSTSANYTPKPATVQVDDDETGVLSLEVPALLTEGSGTLADSATLRLSGPALAPLSVALASSDTTELQAPATVTIPAGADSVTFPLTIPEDDLIDGAQFASLSATVPGYTAAAAALQIADNESRVLSLSFASSGVEGSSIYATLTLPGKLVSPLTVTFASSDTTELSTPSTTTISAGQSSASIYCWLPDDTLRDGSQSATLTASGSGFTSGSAALSVRDNDPASGSWSAITGPKTAGTAFSATLSLQTIDGYPVPGSVSVPITATNSAGSATLAGSPPIYLYVSNGSGSSNITVLTSGTATRLLAAVSGLPAIESNPFDVSSGTAARFEFSALAATQTTGTPVSLTLTARDTHGNVSTGFTGAAALLLQPAHRQIGTGTYSTSTPINAYFPKARTQILYPASSLGGAHTLGGLSLKVLTLPSAPLNNWTIRLKQVSATATTAWESSGWTLAHQSHATVSSTGWVNFPFAAPFAYDGVSNLLVDFSFNNSGYGSHGYVETTSAGYGRAITAYSSSTSDNPLNWVGGTPSPSNLYDIPNLRLHAVTSGGAISPSTTGAFVAGVWTGPLTFTLPGRSLLLRATSGSVSGESTGFDIALAAPLLSPEPLVTGGTANTLAWTPPATSAGTRTTQTQAAPSPAFSAPLESPWLASAEHTFSPLADGQSWHFRARTRLSLPATQTWIQTNQADFDTCTHAGTSAQTLAGSITLAGATDARVENFDQAGTTWSSTLFTNIRGDFNYARAALTVGPNALPALPVNQGGDLEALLTGGTYAGTGDALAPAGSVAPFANGNIEATFAPASPTTILTHAGLLLRASRNGSGNTNGYAAVIIFYDNGTAKADFSRVIDGSYAGTNNWFYSNTSTFSVGASDNIRARFSIQGGTLRLRLWRISSTPTTGVLQETPINFYQGGPELVATDSTYSAAGAPGLYAYGSATRPVLLDDVTVSTNLSGYTTQGTVLSPVLTPSTLHRWGALTYSASTPAGTSLAVDVLDATGSLLASALASDTDLGSLPALSGRTALRLRARLATTNPAITPALENWAVAYESAPPDLYESAWSSTATSIQDATAPSLAITSPALVSSPAYTLAGTASDANGVVALAINGQPTTTTDGFSNWSRVLTLSPGENILTLLATDSATPANTREQTFTVTYRAPDTDTDGLPDAWERAHSLDPASSLGNDGARGDPDGDGLTNILEYATGLAPRAHNASPLTISVAAHPTTGATHLVATYRRLTTPGTLAAVLTTSDNLRDWTPLDLVPDQLSVVPDADGLAETVTVRLNPALDAGRRFVRLEVGVP